MFSDTLPLSPLLGFLEPKKNLFEFADLIYHVLRHLCADLHVAEFRGKVLEMLVFALNKGGEVMQQGAVIL